MADVFELLRFSKTEIVVKHPAEGHLFVFSIAQTTPGRRVIGEGSCRNGSMSKRSAHFLLISARHFAQTEARVLNLIA